ncbi:MAG: peptide chain release factor 1 [Bradymonadaceae bacterium]|nr:peptide chain release factor 1 [Lujinxingiaceae bacterium]
MFDKLQEVEQRYHELNSQLADPQVAADQATFRRIAKEHAHIQALVTAYSRYREVREQIEDNRQMLADKDEAIRQMAKAELEELDVEQEQLEAQMKRLLLPKDPLDEKNIYLEIRAGTGGDEAALFVVDLFRMYSRYAERRGWRVEVSRLSETDRGGYKEIIALIEGDDVYSRLKYEAGVHRVQRVPDTESQGRLHTSAVTVAILVEADDIEIDMQDKDVKVDTYRASGAGGQHVNTTDSAIRVTHVPTGVVVICQDEKSQHKNKAKALKELKARLFERERSEQQLQIATERRDQVGSGDRSERIRTYHWPQSRITDHRIGFTTHRLDDVLAGNLDELIDPLQAFHQAEALQSS